MSSSDGITGYSCVRCGQKPAFFIAGIEPLCYKHLPWNEGKFEEMTPPDAASAASEKPSTTATSEQSDGSSGSALAVEQSTSESTKSHNDGMNCAA